MKALSLYLSKKKLTTLLRSYVSFLCRGHATVSRRKIRHPCAGAMQQCPEEKSVILVQGPCNSVQRKRRRQACVGNEATSFASRGRLLREIRTFGRAVEGSIVSLLTNTMGGLSGERRGGDISGAVSAPFLVVARLHARALALDLAGGIRCPPFVIRKAHANDGSSTPRRKRSAIRSISRASSSAASTHLVRGGLLARGRVSSTLLKHQCNSSAPSRGKVTRSRQNTMRVHPSLPSTFLHGFALQCRTCAASCTGAFFTTLLSQYASVLPRALSPTPSSRPGCVGTPSIRARKEDRFALERLLALLRACS